MDKAGTKEEASLSRANEDVGKRLKFFRKSLSSKCSQLEMSGKLGITQSMYSLYEAGKFEIPKNIRILLEKQFGLNLVWLDTGNGSMFQDDIMNVVKNLFPKLNEENQILVLNIVKQAYVAQCHQDELESL